MELSKQEQAQKKDYREVERQRRRDTRAVAAEARIERPAQKKGSNSNNKPSPKRLRCCRIYSVSPGASSCTIGDVTMSGIGTAFFTSFIAPQYPLGLDITYGGSNLTWTLGLSEQTDDRYKIRTITKFLFLGTPDWLDLINAPYFGRALIMTNQDGSAFPLLPIRYSI